MAFYFEEPSRTFSEYLLIPGYSSTQCIPSQVNLKTPLVKYKKGTEPELDANISNEFCNSFCQLTKQNILGLCIVAEIKFFAMGTEMCVDYSERLDESIKKSHNVMCYWSKKASRD